VNTIGFLGGGVPGKEFSQREKAAYSSSRTLQRQKGREEREDLHVRELVVIYSCCRGREAIC
jgi:hypothetical protein